MTAENILVEGIQGATEDEMKSAMELAQAMGDAINKFADNRKITREKVPLQETLIALGLLMSNGILQQPEAEHEMWVRYIINGVSCGVGVNFLVMPVSNEDAARMMGIPDKEKMN